jgi:hypothetical protein
MDEGEVSSEVKPKQLLDVQQIVTKKPQQQQ